MSAGMGTRLSRKRKNDADLEILSETSPHDMTDDFEDAATVFRLPKKLRTKDSSAPLRPRGRLRKSGTRDASLSDLPLHEGKENSEFLDENSREFVNQSDVLCLESESLKLDCKDEVGEENKFLIDLEKSVCSELEKLCPFCKHIVPSVIFSDHFKECIKRFKVSKERCNKKPAASTSTIDKEEENQGKMEEEGESEGSQVLPCPVCMKSFKSKVQRQSHVKSCAQGHGLTSEQLILVSKLLEKQVEERSQFGLPLPFQQTINHRDIEKVAADKAKRNSKRFTRAAKEDPDLAMAMALSRSMAEEEAAARASREEKLLTLGLDQIVEEDRKAQPILFPPPETDRKKKNTSQSRNKGKKHRGRVQNTALSMCSIEERERRISEKVAAILASDDTPKVNWQITDVLGGKGHLSVYKDKGCRLWEAAHSCTDQPLEGFYVPELEPYIKPKETAVGGLLRRLSQIPGRLNMTVVHAMDEENSDSGSECEETSVIDSYCTQLALAELLGSQECLELTRANASVDDQHTLQGLEPITDPNSTLEAGSGFWFVRPEGDKENGENPQNSESNPTAANHSDTLAVTGNAGSVARNNRNENEKTNEDIVNDRLGRVILKENCHNTKFPVDKNNDCKNEILSMNIGVQEQCVDFEKKLIKWNSEMDERSVVKSPKNDCPHDINIVKAKDKEEDVFKAALAAEKCQDLNICTKPDENLTLHTDESSDNLTEHKDSDGVVIPALNSISEKLLKNNVEKSLTSSLDLSPVSSGFKVQLLHEKLYSPSSLEQIVTNSQKIEDINVVDENSNISGHTVDSDATQILEDDQKSVCVLNPFRKLLTENIPHCSDSEVLLSGVDNKVAEKEEGRKEEQKHVSLPLDNSIAKDSGTCDGFMQSVVQHSHRDSKEVDILNLQSSDYPEQHQSSNQCRSPPPKFRERNCDDERLFLGRDTCINQSKSREYCAEKCLFRQEPTRCMEELTYHPKDKMELNVNFEVATTSKLKDGCLKHEECPQENQAACEEFKPMQEKLLHDWSMLLTSKEESDVTVTTAKNGILSAHSLIFLARCPKLYKEVKDAKMQISWDSVSYEGAYIFLIYLYTGTCKIKAKDDPMWLDVFDLALQYNCKDLVSYMESLYKVHNSPVKTNSPSRNSRKLEVMDDILNSDPDSHLVERMLKSVQGNGVKSERPVKRCLDLSEAGRKNTLLDKFDSRTSPVDRDTIKNSQFGSNYEEIITEANSPYMNSQEGEHIESQNDQGSQSPDLFDESVRIKSISFNSTPSVPATSNHPPCEKSAHAMHHEHGFSSVVGSEEAYNRKYGSSCCYLESQKVNKSDLQNLVVSPEKSLISDKLKVKNIEKPGKEHILYYSMDKNVSSSGIEDQYDLDSPEIEEGNLIDLTLSSSDSSPATCTVNNSDNLTGRLDDSPNLDLNEEEMEPLKLWSSKSSLRVITDTDQQELIMAHDSKSSLIENFNVDEHYISNVWDGFDDIGSSMSVPIDVYPTPEKHSEKTTADCHMIDDDLPALEHVPCERKDGGLATSAKSDTYDTRASESKLACSASSHQHCTEKTLVCKCSDDVGSGTSDTGNFTGSIGQVRAVSKDEKDTTSVSSFHDDTLVKLTTELDDSGLWKEFDEEIDGSKQVCQGGQTTEIIHEPVAHLMTPQTKITGEKKTVTPMPDYKNMSLPKLKKELQKYGVRPISRRKAIILLQHMYEQTHPLVTDSEAESSFSETPQHKTSRCALDETNLCKKVITKSKKSLNAAKGSMYRKTGIKNDKATEMKDMFKDVVEENKLNSSQSSSTSTDCSEYECFEESLMLETGEDEDFTPTQQADLRSQVLLFITTDPELHQKVLLYEPIFVEELLTSLKTNGVKCSMKNLLEILDDQCITFRTQPGQRNRARTRRSKKKKGKSPNKSS